MKTRTICILACLFILISGTVFAQAQYVLKLNVPVRLTDLNEDVEKVRVYGFANLPNASGTIANGEVILDRPSNGAINQTVLVVLKLIPQFADHNIRECSEVTVNLELLVRGEYHRPAAGSQTPIEYRSKSGTQLVVFNSKPIPWPQ